jgi:sugar-phosphatase
MDIQYWDTIHFYGTGKSRATKRTMRSLRKPPSENGIIYPVPRIETRAVLFDMDGTLVDSTGAVMRIWATFATRFGLDVEEILRTSHGVRMIETIRRHAPEGTDADRVAADLGEIEMADREGIEPIPGAAEFVASLPRTRTALVTSATRELADLRMELTGIPMPTVVITAELIEHGKPRPDCYLLAAQQLGVAPEDAVVFEDAEAGVAAGIAAGMRVVVVGDLTSANTVGLPRIRDYRSVTATVADDRLVIEL